MNDATFLTQSNQVIDKVSKRNSKASVRQSGGATGNQKSQSQFGKSVTIEEDTFDAQNAAMRASGLSISDD